MTTTSILLSDLDRDDFRAGFITATLWANSYGDTPSGEAPEEADEDRLSDEDRATLTTSADAFLNAFSHGLALYVAKIDGSPHATTGDGGAWGAAGHDLALTGAGHGTGFWDRGAGRIGEHLSSLARVHGHYGVYVHADGSLSVENG